MIPKVIHYCWFGNKPLTKMSKKCIASWKKYCPDYIIQEWNEGNFDIESCEYVKEAYRAQKWAFVSDYARFKILYEHGGIYFDTDVELVKPIEEIICKGAFMGIEQVDSSINGGIAVAPGLGLAVAPRHNLYKELVEMYKKLHFQNADGTYNLKTVVDYTTECLTCHGLKAEDSIQQIEEIFIYPKEYFNPCNMDTGKVVLTDKTVSIHHYAASWVDGYSLFRGKVYNVLYCVLGKKNTEKIRKIVGRK